MNIRKIFSVFIVICMLAMLAFTASGSFIDELSRKISQREQERQRLEQESQKYQELIIETQKKIRNLKTEIQLMEAEIKKLEVGIKITQGRIEQTMLEIRKLEYEIEETKKNIIHQKEVLAETIRTIYEYDQKDILLLFLEDGSISSFFNQLIWIESLQGKIGEIVEKLKNLKTDLEQRYLAAVSKKKDLKHLKETLENNKTSLKYKTYLYQALVKKTKGKERNFRALLARIETQKKELLGDINKLRKKKEKELAVLKELQEKPKTGLASTSWYFRQDDPRWATNTIGMTRSTMTDYGCAVTAVAMVLTYYQIDVNPATLAKKPLFYYDLIVWPKKWEDVRCMNCPPPHNLSGIDWTGVDKELEDGHPVIIFVKAEGRNAGHYVIIHHKDKQGRYVVHDPLFGPNIYLDSTRVYISKLYDTTTKVDQMVIYH